MRFIELVLPVVVLMVAPQLHGVETPSDISMLQGDAAKTIYEGIMDSGTETKISPSLTRTVKADKNFECERFSYEINKVPKTYNDAFTCRAVSQND